MHVVHQGPQAFNQPGTRWKLSTLLAACDWLRLRTLPGLHQLLARLEIAWKRARQHVHSPDPDYVEKLRAVRLNLLHIDLDGEVFLFQDEFTLHRQPSLASAYEVTGHPQPLAELGWKRNAEWRIAAVLDAWTGQVTFAQTQRFDIPHLVGFYQQVVDTYPGRKIWLVQDNWPIHFHPDVRAALQAQEWKWPLYVAKNWPTEPSARAQHLDLPIQVLQLPTYASWTNPIEKLWRLLKQEVLHLHRFADDWAGLKDEVSRFLTGFAQGSSDLRRYVGLSDPSKLYRALFPT